MRELATIREIKDIRPIDGADLIVCATVDGWECVVLKDEFKVGDKIIFVEIDSKLPERPEFEFMRARKFLVKTIKLRKQISQGLVLSLDLLPNKEYNIGDDVTEVLGITKHDPQGEVEEKIVNPTSKNIFIKFMMQFAWFRKLFVKTRKGGFPSWIRKTDEPRIQNKVILFNKIKEKDMVLDVTEKLDGQSVTFYVDKYLFGYDFGVCSRNLKLPKATTGSYWTIANKYSIEKVLQKIAKFYCAKRVILQGEIIGEGIQGNKYKIKGHDFYAFNLIVDGERLDNSRMVEVLREYEIQTVPILERIYPKVEDLSIPLMVDKSIGASMLSNANTGRIEREGIVCRNSNENISFKVINPHFLLKEKD